MRIVIQDTLTWSSTKKAERRPRFSSQTGAAIQKNQEADVAISITAENFPALAETVARSVAAPHPGCALPQCGSTPVAASDRRRTWLWCFLAVVAASQLYFFRELLAAFAIFTIAFAAVACVAVSLYMLVKCGELALARCFASRHPAENLTSTRNLSPVGSIAAVTRGTENAA